MASHDRGTVVARPPRVGGPAPDFAVLLEDGGTARLADFRDRALLLIFLRHLA